MIKAIYVCDKCGKEEEKEHKSNKHVDSCLDNWSNPSVKLGYQDEKVFLLCPDCSSKIGFEKYGKAVGNYDEKQNAAESLIDMIFELAEDRGLINQGE